MNHRAIILALLSVTLLAACTKRDQGTVVGGVVGGALGSRFGEGSGKVLATALGTFAGAYIGGNIGQKMDENDRMRADRALEGNRTGEPASWRNPDSGHSYTVTPTRTYEGRTGPCREYTTKAVIDGRSDVVRGTACRQTDGSWRAAT